ncbi:pickpocket protein 28-like [Phlebotomus papatasi]|nr:pickpocket protein 28-like [Phlebotomus papatasi]
MSDSPTEKEVRQKIRSGRFRTAIWGFFSDYCNNSTIHGVRYLGEKRRPWTERVWWDDTPVIVTFADKSTFVWQIPFPAVTICPETKVKTEYLNFTKVFKKIFKDEENLTSTDFVPILTEEGFCFTFNTLNASEIYNPSALHPGYEYPIQESESKDWNLEEGYTTLDLSTHPQRALGDGVRVGLYILLKASEKDFDYLCSEMMQGFKVHLHSPDEIPQIARQFFRVPLNQGIMVSVKPSMLTTSEGLRAYNPIRRQCYFNHERQLKFFRNYTQKNCELECLSLFMIKECGCAKFYMPRYTDTPICGSGKISCYYRTISDLVLRTMEEGLQNNYTNSDCNCLPACTSIAYDAEISQTDMDWDKLFEALEIPKDKLEGIRPAILSIYFKDSQFITSRRSELYGLTNFVANCGGLLGLFMGVSLLSIVEIIYFCSIRLINNLKMRRTTKLASN